MQLSRVSAVVMAASVLALAGCEHAHVLGKSLPDETQVVDGPSLALPPQFQLRPPRDAQDYESALRAQKTAEARSLITGVSATQPMAAESGTVPAGDSWLVDQAAAQSGVQADPNVRSELDQAAKADEATDETSEKKANKGLLKRWFGRDDE